MEVFLWIKVRHSLLWLLSKRKFSSCNERRFNGTIKSGLLRVHQDSTTLQYKVDMCELIPFH